MPPSASLGGVPRSGLLGPERVTTFTVLPTRFRLVSRRPPQASLVRGPGFRLPGPGVQNRGSPAVSWEGRRVFRCGRRGGGKTRRPSGVPSASPPCHVLSFTASRGETTAQQSVSDLATVQSSGSRGEVDPTSVRLPATPPVSPVPSLPRGGRDLAWEGVHV